MYAGWWWLARSCSSATGATTACLALRSLRARARPRAPVSLGQSEAWSALAGHTGLTLVDIVPRQDGIARGAYRCPVVDHLARRGVRLARDAVVARDEAAQVVRSRRIAQRVAHLTPTALAQVEKYQGSLVARRRLVPPPRECLGKVRSARLELVGDGQQLRCWLCRLGE